MRSTRKDHDRQGNTSIIIVFPQEKRISFLRCLFYGALLGVGLKVLVVICSGGGG